MTLISIEITIQLLSVEIAIYETPTHYIIKIKRVYEVTITTESRRL